MYNWIMSNDGNDYCPCVDCLPATFWFQCQYNNFLHCKRMGIYIFCNTPLWMFATNPNSASLHWRKDCHTCYSYQQAICMFIIIMSCPPTHAGLELSVRNIMNVLREAGFSFGHWEQLGQQLIEYGTLATFRANRGGDSHLCMSDTIFQWLNNDLDNSWEKLAGAVAKVEKYGHATANCVLRKAGIILQCMFYVRCMWANEFTFYVWSMYICIPLIMNAANFLSMTAGTAVTPKKQRASPQSLPTVDRHCEPCSFYHWEQWKASIKCI